MSIICLERLNCIREMKSLIRLFIYRKKLVKPYVDQLLTILNMASIVASFLFLVTMIFEHGFIVSGSDHTVIDNIYSLILGLFLIHSILRVILDFKGMYQQYGKVAWGVTLLLYFTLIPIFYEEPTSKFLGWFWGLFDSSIYQGVVLLILSLLHLSDWVVKLLSKRINPSFIVAASFMVIILVGAGLLMLPRATYGGISFIDALFISTSATCVTGLSTIDVAAVFTPVGMTFIMILIQIGGLGIMTLTSFFALFFMGNTSLCNQTMLSDMVSSKSLSSLLTTLLYILGFTAVVELVGAAVILLSVHGTLGMTFREEVAFSVFHSISAFCNAGFSTLPNNLGNEMLMSGHNLFYVAISLLVILGGIGFPILVNLNEWMKYFIGRVKMQFKQHTFRVDRKIHIYDINSKIAAIVTVGLILLGTIFIGMLEWNGAFSGMPFLDKCVQSFFMAVTPRTAGFSSVSMGVFSLQTILLLLFFMVIGGGAQSTAGGIKVNAFAVIMLNIKAIIQGDERVTVFNRELSVDSIRRSNSTMMLYMLFVFVALFLLSIFEPDAPLIALIFEAISALSTVGASLDLTPTLGTDSKLVVIALMFVGRVGVLTIMSSLVRQHRSKRVGYASGNIILN